MGFYKRIKTDIELGKTNLLSQLYLHRENSLPNVWAEEDEDEEDYSSIKKEILPPVDFF